MRSIVPLLLVFVASACTLKPRPTPNALGRGETALGPTIATDPDGSRWFVSDGRRYPLDRVDVRDVVIRSNLATRLAELTRPPPDRYMLDELGWVTEVDHQLNRGACTVFAALGAVESEYLRQYGITLDLSEQYVINMMNENRHPTWVGGAAAEKLLIASYYAVPPEEDWAYPDERPAQQLVDAVFGLDRAANPAAGDALDGRVWEQSLERDLANYGRAVYPSDVVHQAAVYGPMPGAVAAVPLDGTAAPLEQVLAAGHAIAFSTSMASWEPSSAGHYVYKAKATVDHTMLLIGYDRTRKVFRVKNSWGTAFNGTGFAEASYELITKTVNSAVYVTELRPPGKVTPGAGTGALRGFWRGGLGSGETVMVLRHPFLDPGGLNLAGSDAGTLYLGGSTTRGLTWVSGSPTTMTLDVKGDPVVKQITLTRDGDGWVLTGHGSAEGSAVKIGGRWCRTSNSRDSTLTPASYAATVDDPQVFPKGPCVPVTSWERSVVVAPN
jgi:hypothetical protein